MLPAARYKAVRRSGFARQRMNKTSTYTAVGGNTYTKVTGGWASDATYPCTVQSDSLKVTGTGTVTVAWSLAGTGSGLQIKRGSTIVVGPGAARTGSATIAVSDGDLLSVEILMAFFPNSSTVTAGGYIEIYQ